MNAKNPHRPSLAAAIASLAVLVVLGASCSIPLPAARPALERHYYMLEPAREGTVAPTNSKTILKVRPFTVSPGFDTHEFIYKVGDQRFETDYYNLLFMQPGPAVTLASRKWLDASGLFGHVVDSTSQADETHALEGNLVALYGDYSNPQAPKAVLEMQFFLLKENKGDYTVAFQKNYRQETPLSGGTAQNLADGMQKSLGAILASLEGDLKGVVGK
jgi:cholesterol transport system auxiliary component